MNPLLKKVLANTSWLASEKVITMAANLLVALLLARSLNPEGYGSLSYLLAIIALVGPLTSLGLNAIITRELVNQPERNDAIMATASGFRLLGAGVGTALCLILAVTGWGLSGAVDQWAMAMLALANLLTAFHVIEFWFQAHVAAKAVARMRVSVIVLFSIAKIIAALSGAGLLLICGLFALEMACIGIGFMLIYRRAQGAIQWNELDASYGLQLLKQGFWLVLSGIAAVIYLKVDQVMLAQMVNREAVGVYAVAARLSEVWYFFATAIAISLFPALLKLKQTNPDRYQQRLQQICDVLFVAALVLAIGITLIATPLVRILFGQDYLPAAAILTIHIWGSVFIYMRALVSKWLIAEHLLAFSLVSHGLGALINIAANWYLIPLYGGIGAAWATILSYLVASYIAFWFASSTRPIAKVMTRSLLLPFTLGYRYWR
ncbi:flippase [Alkalimonas collagenimarina]|uniref:Flippase n=1 Tax=Alkalimonas collagenimarina TaxID=400390 RepID=A0ABT9H1F2_9GAMM|nr:flippase [Alkalimonas collagenimarina]MDP4536904.1 flippase [Alkalimonas collagenimarina]